MGNLARLHINANFDKTGITTEGSSILDMWFPQGLTYMQTVKFTTDKQQQIFRNGTGGDLKGTFSDPPQGGFTLPDGSKVFENDKTPW